MGLGALFHRDLKVTTEDTVSGETAIHTIVTGTGAYPDWSSRGAYRGGMGIPGASRAALLQAGLLGAVPWHAYTGDELGITERVRPTPPLLEQPCPPDTSVVTISSLVLDLIWHGNAVEIITTRDALGYATSTLPVPVEYAHVKRVERGDGIPFPLGNVAYWISPYPASETSDPSTGRWYSHHDVIHTKGPCRPGALRGMGVLENHLGTLDLAHEQRRQAANATGQGIPTGTLKSENPDLTGPEAADLKAKWMQAQRDRSVAVLNATTSFEALAWNPKDSQLLEARQFGLHEIALIFGVDPSWLGAAQASRTYSNVEQEGINLRVYSALADHLARLEAARSAQLPIGMVARANLDAVLRADTLGRYRAHEIGIRNGFLTDDEVRAMEGRRPLTPDQRAQIAASRPQPPAGAGPGGDEDEDADEGDGPPEEGARSEADLWIYWTAGKGRAKWTRKREPLRALYDQLLKHFTPDRARATALAWFPDGMGRAPKPSDGELPGGED